MLGTLSFQAFGFSLLGPYEPWMDTTNGFRQSGDIGGPMDISSGYRWNVPVVTYGFDQSFVDAFGTNGVAAVESAIAVLNNLPPASQLDPSNFPTETTRVNFVAASQSLVDLKSTTLFLLLEQLGLAQPTRSAFSIHDFSINNNTVTATILDRNFDPFSFSPSDYVNSTAYSYYLSSGYDSTGQAYAEALAFPIDALAPSFTAVADHGGSQTLDFGSFYTGLTRDDVGGLRYLLLTNNYNFERLLPDVHGTGSNTDNYVNLALRSGVDKINFVRQDFDETSGEAYVPLTNSYTDTYLTNGIPVSQQLERIVSKPDFIFSASSDLGNSVGYSCTGTSNWSNNAAVNGNPSSAGPGTIVPQVHISFQKYGLWETFETGDSPPLNVPDIQIARWGIFDDSTNAPTTFPNGSTVDQVNDLKVSLSLLDPKAIAHGTFNWDVPLALGGTANIQTSSNLLNWLTAATITNYGLPVEWSHFYSLPQGFFRVVPTQ